MKANYLRLTPELKYACNAIILAEVELLKSDSVKGDGQNSYVLA